MDRETYLNSVWSAYPAMNPHFALAGRVKALAPGSLEIAGQGIFSLTGKARELAALLRKNDWVAIELHENSVTDIQLLAPCLEEPMGLSSSPSLQGQWFYFLQQIRLFFVGKAFQEAQTPTLVACPGTEPFLDFFSTEWKRGSQTQKLFLPSSPELHLKKMLSAGYENIFEIKSCFRNGEISNRHQPEFTMLEWYRSFKTLDQIVQDCLHLLEFLGAPTEKFQRQSMAELFHRTLDFKLTPQTTIEDLKTLAKKLQLSAENYDLWDDVFYLIFIERVEPKIDSQQPFFLEKYPPSQAALARLTDDGWGDRFELYWKGFELANAFHELNDPQIQQLRFQEDLEKKRHLGKETPPLDTDFLRALRSGMPPSAGIALGLERLFMALNGISDISEIKVFPYRSKV